MHIHTEYIPKPICFICESTINLLLLLLLYDAVDTVVATLFLINDSPKLNHTASAQYCLLFHFILFSVFPIALVYFTRNNCAVQWKRVLKYCHGFVCVCVADVPFEINYSSLHSSLFVKSSE